MGNRQTIREQIAELKKQQKTIVEKQIMEILKENPRAKLTEISNKLDIPVSSTFDTLNRILKEYKFNGTFKKVGK